MSLARPLSLAPAARRPSESVLPWWFLLVWQGALGYAWWATAVDQLGALPRFVEAAGPGSGLAIAALYSVLGRYAGFLIEAGCYTLAWMGFGGRLGFWRAAAWIASFSALDLVAAAIRDVVADGHEALAPWLAPIVGLGLIQPREGANALWVGFGSLGALTVLRIVLTANIQASALGRTVWTPLALTTSVWLATRLILWWGYDLARGMSRGM